MSAVMEEKQKETAPTYWECSSCSNWVVVYVKPSAPPCCNNPKHSTRSVLMVEKTPPEGRIKK
jgi:hypothetical protein